MKSKITDNKIKLDQNILLKEYEIANNKTQYIESLIWKTFSMIGIVSITLLLSINIFQASVYWRTMIILADFSIALTIIWWKIAERWWDIQSALYLRIRHIEEDLGIFSNRYICSLDGAYSKEYIKEIPNNILSKERKNEVKYSYSFGKKGVQKYFSWTLLVLPICWISRIAIALPSEILEHIKNIFKSINIIALVMLIFFVVEDIYAIIFFFEKQYSANRSINKAILKSYGNIEIVIETINKKRNIKSKKMFRKIRHYVSKDERIYQGNIINNELYNWFKIIRDKMKKEKT